MRHIYTPCIYADGYIAFAFPLVINDRGPDPQCLRSSPRLSIQVSSVYCSKIDVILLQLPPPPSTHTYVSGLGMSGHGGGGVAGQGTFSSYDNCSCASCAIFIFIFIFIHPL